MADSDNQNIYGTNSTLIQYVNGKIAEVNTATWPNWGNTAATTYNYFNYSNVVTGFTAAVNSTLLLDSIATLATGTVYFPSSPANGQVVKIASNNAVTALTLRANTGIILGNALSNSVL